MTAAVLALDAPIADEIDEIVETRILRFLNGESDGRELLETLYGAPMDEPVPASMLALIRASER